MHDGSQEEGVARELEEPEVVLPNKLLYACFP